MGERRDSLLERSELKLEPIELFARAQKHLALHVELFASDEIEPREKARQHRAHVLLEIGGGTAREDFAHALVEVAQDFLVHRSFECVVAYASILPQRRVAAPMH